MAQDRLDMAVTATVLPQRMAVPTEGAEVCLKGGIRHLASHPGGGGSLEVRSRSPCAVGLTVGRVGGVTSQKSCSGGCIQRRGGGTCLWSKAQTNVALISGDADLSSAGKGISGAIGVRRAITELFWEVWTTLFSVEASAVKWMLFRTGVGEVKHLSSKLLLVQGGIQSCGVEERKVPRARDTSDILIHPVGISELRQGLRRVE